VRELCAEYPVSLLCSALEVPRSSFYYKAKGRDDEEVIQQILSIACQFPRYGYRRITAELRRRGYRVNHKKVLRLMRKMKLLVRQAEKPRTTIPASWRKHLSIPSPRFTTVIMKFSIFRIDTYLFSRIQG